MNAKFYVFIFAVMLSFFIAAPQGAKGEEKPDTCWKLIWPHIPEKGWFNPLSVMVDSCPNSPTYLKEFAKEVYQIELMYYEIDLPEMPWDTIVYINIDDIDTTHQQLISDLRRIDTVFGNYIMWKASPQWVDSSHASKKYNITFDNYCRIDSFRYVVCRLPSFYGFGCRYVPSHYKLAGDVINEEIGFNKNIAFFPNPCSELFNIKYDLNRITELKIKILNNLGANVKEVNIQNNEYEQAVTINVSGLPAGIYFCIIQNNDSIITRKFSIIR